MTHQVYPGYYSDPDPLFVDVDEEPWYPDLDELDAVVVGSGVWAYALLLVLAGLVAVLAVFGVAKAVRR